MLKSLKMTSHALKPRFWTWNIFRPHIWWWWGKASGGSTLSPDPTTFGPDLPRVCPDTFRVFPVLFQNPELPCFHAHFHHFWSLFQSLEGCQRLGKGGHWVLRGRPVFGWRNPGGSAFVHLFSGRKSPKTGVFVAFSTYLPGRAPVIRPRLPKDPAGVGKLGEGWLRPVRVLRTRQDSGISL